MVRPYRLAIATIAFGFFVDAVLWFYAKSPRSRMNITEVVSVVFFAILMIAFAKVQKQRDSEFQPSNESLVVPALAVLAGISVWTSMLPFYFINDDFGLLYMSRTPLPHLMWSLFRHGDGTFYRPLGFSSFAWDHAIWGDLPFGFHITNLLLHIGSLAGLFVMLRQLGVRRHTAAMTAGIYAAMPVLVEPVAWMSGRFDVMTTTLAVWSVASYTWSRSRNNIVGYAIATALYILAICAKETGFVVPLLLIATELIIFRRKPNWRIAGFLLTGGLVFLYRMFAIGGIGGYQRGGGSLATSFGWSAVEGVFLRSPSQMLFGLNWLQPSGILVTTLAAAIAAVLLLLATRAALDVEQRRIATVALIWTLVTLLPAHFLSLIGPGLTNSRILCLPTVGFAIVLGQLLGSIRSPRFQTALFIILVAVLNLAVLHNLAAWRWTSRLGKNTVQQIVKVVQAPPPNAQFVVSNLPETIRGVLFFEACLPQALMLAYGRDDISAVRDLNSVTAEEAAAPPPRIYLTWTGEPDELVVLKN